MAKLKTNKYPISTAAIVEDPIPGADKLYFWLDAYDKITLASILDVGLNQNTSSNDVAGFGSSRPTQSSLFARLLLMGNTVDVQLRTNNDNTQYANIEPLTWMSMDSSRPIKKVRYDTDGTNKVVSMWGAIVGPDSVNPNMGPGFPQSGQYFTTVNVRFNPEAINISLPRVNNGGASGSALFFSSNSPSSLGRCGPLHYPVFYNAATNNLVVMSFGGILDSGNIGAYNSNQGGTQYTPSAAFCSFTSWISTSPGGGRDSPTYQYNKTNQFLGLDASNRCLFFTNDLTTDYNHIIYRYADSDNTVATLFSNSTAPSAGGTSLGGNRGTSYGQYLSKYSCSVFADATSSGNSAWYTPYLDSAGYFHPFFFQWNRSADTFTRNADITMNWGATTQSSIWEPDNVSGSGVNTTYGLQRLWALDTWSLIVSGTERRYLMLMQLHGNGTKYDGSPKMRTFVVFWINPVSPKTLNYHSHIEIPSTPKNIIWLNAEKTQLGVVGESNFYMYSFTNATGWTQTTIIPIKFASVGLDNLGRLWALEAGDNTYGAIHTLTQTAPITVAVTSTATAYNYVGTQVLSNVTVNAYGVDGLRKAVSVRLVIDGTSMTFSGSNLTTTVTTSASTDTSVPIIITGAGINNIIASVVL